MCLVTSPCAGLLAAENAEEPGERVGRLIRVDLPITAKTFERVRRQVRRFLDQEGAAEQPTLIFEFDVPQGSEFGRGSEFGAALDLADFLTSDEVNVANTVAYLPESIKGHAVLVVLACEKIIMAPGTEFGAAGADEETITEARRTNYRDIAERRRTVAPEIAVGLLDPSVEVLEVDTERGTEYVFPENLAALRENRTFRSEPEKLFAAGQPGSLSAGEARKRLIVSRLASNRKELAEALDLPREAVQEDPALAEEGRAIMVKLEGPIDNKKVNQIQKMIDDKIRERVPNYLFVWIDSPGGSLADAGQLANYILDVGAEEIRTVAYIENQARAEAALVAVACDHVVMHPGAILGGPSQHQITEAEISDLRDTIRDNIAPKTARSWSLVAAMFDPNLQVSRCTRLGDPKDVEYFSDEELADRRDKDDWEKGRPITARGQVLQVNGDDAEKYRLATYVVESFGELKRLYSLENDPELVEPSWADILIKALASPELGILLLMIGGAALYIELQMPGIGIGGFVALVCFLLFFWSRFLGQTAGWLEVILFLTGIGCLVLEIFIIPGFGIFGLGGGMLVIVSLVLASQTFFWPSTSEEFRQFQSSLMVLAGAGVGMLVLVMVMRRFLPHTPGFSHLLLKPAEAEEREQISQREALVHLEDLAGSEGVTATQLTPSGKARFGDRLVDVMADGEIIPRGTPIVVAEVRGSRVLVRRAGEET